MGCSLAAARCRPGDGGELAPHPEIGRRHPIEKIRGDPQLLPGRFGVSGLAVKEARKKSGS